MKIKLEYFVSELIKGLLRRVYKIYRDKYILWTLYIKILKYRCILYAMLKVVQTK